ncbi:MAG TPA: TetR-like C-terminal domain-containing protein [Polyangiales bacterium]|nr:TetR-like C-terminal domain-containing protein [Polyangiales bacterium]
MLASVLARGIERGELHADLDPELMRDLLFGPAIYHLLITANRSGKRAPRTTVDATWNALCSRT